MNDKNTVSLQDFAVMKPYNGEQLLCEGCENKCVVHRFIFENGNSYYSGNKCEKIYSNKGSASGKGTDFYQYKYKQVFKNAGTPGKIVDRAYTVGIPRILNIYENYPFWNTLFSHCGIKVQLSRRSTMKLYERGLSTVMSDNICFPAKLAHGHIFDLIERKVDRIFFPFVVHDRKEDEKTANSYNCPIVAGYSEVIRSAINPDRYGIPFDSPTITFNNEKLLKKACREYFDSIRTEVNIDRKTFDHAFDQALKVQYDYCEDLTRENHRILTEAREKGRMVILLAGRPYHADPLIQHKISEMIADFDVDIISEDLLRQETTDDFDDVQSVLQWAYSTRIIKAARWVAASDDNVHFVQMTSFGCGPDAFILDEVNDILRRKGKNLTILKIDDVNNIGSLRLRMRSLIESLKFKNKIVRDKKIKNGLVQTPPFTEKDRGRTLLAPYFADFYSPFVPTIFNMMGYKIENLPPSDQLSAQYGLKYSNNEICYPATLIVGDMVKALESGKYKREEVALAITQTGGQCRATSYISLIKKALINAGYDDIPVVAIATGGTMVNEQPGFSPDYKKVIRIAIYSLYYADALSTMFYATAPREKEKGGALRLRDKYLSDVQSFVAEKDSKGMLNLLKQAAEDFNRMAEDLSVPQIGIVGEIFVKYNAFAHKSVVNWLIEQGVEPVVPGLTDFFTQFFVNTPAAVANNFDTSSMPTPLLKLIEMYVNRCSRKVEKAASGFRYFRPFSNIHRDAALAERIISLSAQFGEGWLIPAEFAHFAETGIRNAVSLQPFGCIANHIVAKGIEKRVKQFYPDMNLLFLDFDSGVSEVNILNRLFFMIKNATEYMTAKV
ncbi:MAG: acyl-CoA dehydratase activase-related protein [Candidatus Azobacteroides sp.]|nr:acyl-CoA dehydratase activase-related protein [Candidatus Azobacteroides sp.]